MNYKVIAWGLGALILIVLFIFYLAYSKYARQKVARHAVNGLERVIKRTRVILIILILVLAGDIGYGKFAPHSSMASGNLVSRTGKAVEGLKTKIFGNSESESVAKVKKAEKAEKEKKASSEKKSHAMTGEKATEIVKNYYAKNGTEQDVEKYSFIKSKTSTVSNQKVYEVGAYKTENGKLVQIHDFEVNLKGKFDLLY
ncbi:MULTISPECIES: hypothetical protein [Pediococcus]|jgi:hypothetical protein|nr:MULTISPECIES: hypothetical protein [Pediococcus]MCT3027501.1 hypothetical protein [Pediococcus parvulus]MCT3028272.1 hypothetical protein [Pediococcus parvulus]MCT3031773.1 hypothetical protein [Pediococcus parvulus]MCT3035772.1 hypothetical protein [Pediococcus parvulus]GEL90160.1 hypothetical protein PPA04_13910 [Pediococcus parvulus]